MVKSKADPIVMEVVTDPVEIAQADHQRKQFDHNWAWWQARAPRIGDEHRGRFICVANEELFVADDLQAVMALAVSAHPDDHGRFILYIPREKRARVYANQR